MIKLSQLLTLVTASALFSCSISERKIAGTYHLKEESRTRLVLHKDNTFEFVKNFDEPGPVFFPDSTERNFRTKGNWTLNEEKKVVLNSFNNKTLTPSLHDRDSIIPNTTLTSFSFWNHYGDPVAIRFIKFPPDKIKLYNANTISFFAGDFAKTDTLEFHFYGYRPVKWPNHFIQNMADNFSHRVTLFEEHRDGFFSNVIFFPSKKKLISPDKSFAMYKLD